MIDGLEVQSMDFTSPPDDFGNQPSVHIGSINPRLYGLIDVQQST